MASSALSSRVSGWAANLAPLTPIDFLHRTADVHPEQCAIIHGEHRIDYGTFRDRCCRLAAALEGLGIEPGSVVSVLAPNTPAHLELHFAVPMVGGILNSVNTRLDADSIAYILDHAETRVLVVDSELVPLATEALKRASGTPVTVEVGDLLGPSLTGIGIDYERLVAEGDPAYRGSGPADEREPIALNYTSGTTGRAKGVVYEHRGAYLNALGNAVTWEMGRHPIYLWTLPMFHCNGWCFPWTVTLLAGTHVCLRTTSPESIAREMGRTGVTHFCAAPIVLNFLANASAEVTRTLPLHFKVMTAGAAPPPSVIAAIEALGGDVIHVYGLTEVYGPTVVCEWKAAWNSHSPEERAAIKARQGVRHSLLTGLDVVDPESHRPVPADGMSQGEIVFRGNIVMKGYFKDPAATEDALRGGWFHSGDIAVRHPDGYVQIVDRSKDLIISGGENISSAEVEAVLYRHPAVLEAAVVAKPDQKWGEVPCAFIALKPGAAAEAAEIIAHCRAQLAGFKVPKAIVFDAIPKTSTGKPQKFLLRERARRDAEQGV